MPYLPDLLTLQSRQPDHESIRHRGHHRHHRFPRYNPQETISLIEGHQHVGLGKFGGTVKAHRGTLQG